MALPNLGADPRRPDFVLGCSHSYSIWQSSWFLLWHRPRSNLNPKMWSYPRFWIPVILHVITWVPGRAGGMAALQSRQDSCILFAADLLHDLRQVTWQGSAAASAAGWEAPMWGWLWTNPTWDLTIRARIPNFGQLHSKAGLQPLGPGLAPKQGLEPQTRERRI